MNKGSFKKLFLVFLLLFLLLFAASLSAQTKSTEPKSVLPDFLKEMMEQDIARLKPIDFDWDAVEWIDHEAIEAAEAEALLAEQAIANEKTNTQARVQGKLKVLADEPDSMTWEPAIPHGSSVPATNNNFPPSMRKGYYLNMPQDAYEKFKTPAFWYGEKGSGRKASYIDANGIYVKGTHDPLSDGYTDEGATNAYSTTQLEMEMWFKELSENPQFQGANRRMQHKLISGIPHYTGNVNDYQLTRTFNMILAVFSKPSVFTPEEVKALGKPTVLLHASIHGGESCPAEAMLQVAKELAEGKHDDVLDKVTVVMIPRINVTGAWNFHRGTRSVAPIGHGGQSEGGFDMNRDNLGWESHEIRMVRYIANRYNPVAGIDGHEQGGFYDNAEQYLTSDGVTYAANGGFRRGVDATISISTSNNININKDVRALGRYLYEPAMKKWLDDNRLGANWYRSGTSVTPTMPSETTYLVTDVVSSDGISGPIPGRISWPGTQQDTTLTPGDQVIMNGIGLGNQSIHFCIEASRVATPRVGYLRVVYGEYACNISLLKTTAEHRDIVTSVVNHARQLEIDNADTIAMWSERPSLASTNEWSVTEYADWRKADIPEVVNAIRFAKRPIKEVRAFFSEKHPDYTIKRPNAYILKPEHYLAACRLFFSGLTNIERLAEDTMLEVEVYTPLTIGGAGIASYVDSGNLPQMTQAIHSVSKTYKYITFPKGSFVFKMDSLGGVITGLLLEPMGTVNYGNMWLSRTKGTSGTLANIPAWYRDNFLPVTIGQDFPAYRFMGWNDSLKTYPARLNLPMMLTVVERVHSPTQEKVEQIKADLGLSVDPEYVSLIELPVLSSDASYKSWSRVDVNEAFLLPNGQVVKIEADNIVNGNNWVEKSFSFSSEPPVVLIVAPKGLGGDVIYAAKKGGGFTKIYEKAIDPDPDPDPDPKESNGGCSTVPLIALLAIIPLVAIIKRK